MTVDNKKRASGSSYLIIGSGRLATHLSHYFKLLNVEALQWNRSQSTEGLKEFLSLKPTVILAISDSALENFFQEHLFGMNLTVVHCSGAFHSDHMVSCHPLMTFGPALYDLDSYKKIFFAVTGIESLQQLFPFLSNSSFVLNAKDKPLYHALCVLSAAGAQKIWIESEKFLSGMGVPYGAMKPYLKQITENYLSNGSSALTGPWVRGDEKTIQKNLDALSQTTSDSLFKIYDILKEGRL